MRFQSLYILKLSFFFAFKQKSLGHPGHQNIVEARAPKIHMAPLLGHLDNQQSTGFVSHLPLAFILVCAEEKK